MLLLRFASASLLLVALDSLVCIALWLAGGDSLYLEDSVRDFSFTHSTFDLVVLAAVRGVVLAGCFYLLEHNGILSASVKNDLRNFFSERIALLCELFVILVISGASFVYAVIKGGIIIHSIVVGTWNGVSKEIEMHITYKILCITGVMFPLLEVAIGLFLLVCVRNITRIQKLKLLVNLEEGEGPVHAVPVPPKKANIKRIILTAKPVSIN